MRPSTIEKQQKIIEIATALFLEQGYKDTSLDQIVALTGGSKQTLYRYFSNKEGLFKAVLVEKTKSVDPIFDFCGKHGQSVRESLQQFGHAYLHLICGNPILGLFRIVSNDFYCNEEFSQLFWRNGPRRAHAYLVNYLEQDVVQAQLSIRDPALACSQLLGLIRQDYHSQAMLGCELPPDEVLAPHIDTCIDAFFMLYQRR